MLGQCVDTRLRGYDGMESWGEWRVRILCGALQKNSPASIHRVSLKTVIPAQAATSYTAMNSQFSINAA